MMQRISQEIERSIRESIKESSRVVVHVEPEKTARGSSCPPHGG